MKTATPKLTKDRRVASLRGLVENEVTPSTASCSILPNGYFVSPCSRAARVYSIPICLKPAQANMPRMKRAFSGIASTESRARRLTRRKSPVSFGDLGQSRNQAGDTPSSLMQGTTIE